MHPGEKRPCWYCGGRKTIQVNEKDGKGRTRSVTKPCPQCNGTGVQ
jgi:DnaJ-class molecular chaperone